MRLPDLLKILTKLSSKELKAFQKFHKKRFPNSLTSWRILAQLEKAHPHFESPQFKRESLFKKALEKTFDPKRWSKELKTLELQLQEYLILNLLEEKKIEKELLLLQVYKKHQVEDLFFQQIKDSKKLAAQAPVDLWYWQRQFQLEHEHYFSPLSENTKTSEASVERGMQQLDTFYAVAKLKYACELQNRHLALQSPVPHIPLLAELPPSKIIAENVYFQLYQKMYALLCEQSAKVYFETKAFVFQHLPGISATDQFTLLGYLQNSAQKCLDPQGQNLREEMFELYQFGIDHDIFIIEGYFDKEFFINIIDLACKLEKFDWGDRFLNNTADQLEESIREDSVLIAQALLCFSKGDYDTTIDLLKDLKFVNVFYKIRANLLLIASYYEQGAPSELTLSKCEAFGKSIHRDKILSTATQQMGLNFISIVKQLTAKVNPPKEKLRHKVREEKYLFFRIWLQQKIELL